MDKWPLSLDGQNAMVSAVHGSRQRGLHIAFTGIDGSGKSTQAGRLSRWLIDQGRPSFFMEHVKPDFSKQLLLAITRANGHYNTREFIGAPFFEMARWMELARNHFEFLVPL